MPLCGPSGVDVRLPAGFEKVAIRDDERRRGGDLACYKAEGNVLSKAAAGQERAGRSGDLLEERQTESGPHRREERQGILMTIDFRST